MKIVAKALVTDKRGDILVLRRSGTHPHFAYHYDFPGGEVEQDEDPSQAVIREIHEETGIITTPSQLTLCFRKDILNDLQHLLYVVTVDEIAPQPTISWEHDAYTWFASGDLLGQPLPPNVDPYYADVMAWLQQQRM